MKVAIVTGASQGIGAGIAGALVGAGYAVVGQRGGSGSPPSAGALGVGDSVPMAPPFPGIRSHALTGT